MANELTVYQSVLDDVKEFITAGLKRAYSATNRAIVQTYWNIGQTHC